MGVNLASFYDGGRQGYINGDTGAFAGENYPNNPITTGYIPVTAGVEYSISMTNDEKMGAMWVGWLFYDSEKKPNGKRTAVTAGSVGRWSQTVTAPEGAAYMRVSYRLRDGVKLKVEEGQPTEWTPNPTDHERQQKTGSVHPMFAADYDSEWWNGVNALYQRLDDGWVRIYEDRTGQTGWGSQRGAYPSLSPHVVNDGELHLHTMLIEIADNNSSGSIQWYDTANDSVNQLTKASVSKNLGNVENWGDGVHRLVIPTNQATADLARLLYYRYRVGADSKLDLKMRVSVYPGLYFGGYMPYRVEEDRPQTPRVLVYSHADEPLGELAPADVMDLRRTEEVNGEHCLSITTTQILGKGMRILMQDTMGVWREYAVTGTDENHESGRTAIGTYYCTWSLQHDLSVTPVSVMPGVQSPVRAAVALEQLLSTTTRWGVGTVTRTSTGGASMYRTTAWEALGVLTEVWGGEIDAQIEVDSTGVVSRKVALYETQGKSTATRRFDWGGDITGIRRTVEDVPNVCRIIPLGKGEQTEGGGYGRKITIESVNGGKDYLENSSMAPLCRMPDGSGGWEYPSKYVENSDMETPADLKMWAESVLEDETSPKVMYEASVLQFAQAGLDVQGVALGDAVHIVDREFDEEGVRVNGRVMKLVVNELDPTDISCTVGNLSEGLAGAFSSLSAKVERVTSTVSNMNGGNLSTADYLNRLLSMVNSEINAEGGYTYLTQGQGIRTYDKAVSDPLVGVEATKVVEIKGGSMRIADSRTSSGEWDWRTVFTSGHIAADLVTAGNITAGYIGSPSGNYWNLDSGELRMANSAEIGGMTVQQLVEDVNATISNVDVEFAQNQSQTTAPATGWSTTAPQWREGWYIWQRTATTTPTSVTYSQPTCISGRDGADGSSVSILGSYNTYAELVAEHPTGNIGDGYIVAGDLYVWDGSGWDNVGQIQGPQGPAGQDGASITVTTVEYGISDSASAEPQSWSTTPPTSIAEGMWLWVKTTYSDSTSTVTKSYVGTDGQDGTSVWVKSATKTGDTTTVVITDSEGHDSTLTIKDGEDGDDGTAGADGLSGYVHVAWAMSADGSEGFSTSVSEGKTYLGTYTDHTQADSQRYQDYSWSKIKGEDGADGEAGAAGADGIGVSAVVEQYYLSKSNTSQTGGSWSDTQPVWMKGRYIWTRTRVTWTSGSVTYTDPVLAQAVNSANATASDAADAVDGAVGYYNLNPFFTNTFDDIYDAKANPKGYWRTLTSGVWTQLEDGWAHLSYENTGTAAAYTGGFMPVPQSFVDAGKSYTLLIEVRNVSTAPTNVSFSSGAAYQLSGAALTDFSEGSHYVTLTARSNMSACTHLVRGRFNVAAGASVELDIRVSVYAQGYTGRYLPYVTPKVYITDAVEEVGDAIEALDGSLDQQGVFNRLTNNGAAQGIYLDNGKLYVNAEYIVSGIIADKAGKNRWNLTTGALVTDSMTATNINANGEFLTDGDQKIRYNLLDFYLRTRVVGGKVQYYVRRDGQTTWELVGSVEGRMDHYSNQSGKSYMHELGINGQTDFYLGTKKWNSNYQPLVYTKSGYKTLTAGVSGRSRLQFTASDGATLCDSKTLTLEGMAVSNGALAPKPVKVRGSVFYVEILTMSGGSLVTKKYEFNRSNFVK